jgi:hypothetical protein
VFHYYYYLCYETGVLFTCGRVWLNYNYTRLFRTTLWWMRVVASLVLGGGRSGDEVAWRPWLIQIEDKIPYGVHKKASMMSRLVNNSWLGSGDKGYMLSQRLRVWRCTISLIMWYNRKFELKYFSKLWLNNGIQSWFHNLSRSSLCFKCSNVASLNHDGHRGGRHGLTSSMSMLHDILTASCIFYFLDL